MISLEDLPIVSSKTVIDDGGLQSFLSTPTCHMPVVNFLLDELIDSRLQIEGSLDAVVHRVPPCVIIFHQSVHLSSAARPCRRDQATLDILELLDPLRRSLDVL